MALKHRLKRKQNEENDAQVVPAKRMSDEPAAAKVSS